MDVVHSVLVAADVTQDCLLGIDFLSKHNCKIDFKAQTIKIKNKVVGLKGKSGARNFFRINLAETVVVPGRCEMVLYAELSEAVCGDGLFSVEVYKSVY